MIIHFIVIVATTIYNDSLFIDTFLKISKEPLMIKAQEGRDGNDE